MARALVVDDDHTLRFVMAEILRQADYQPIEAENGLEALNTLKEDANFDVILSDVHMPKMDGIRLLEELRLKYPDIPVIILSVNPNFETLEKGAFACLPKPFSRRQLLDAVRAAARVELTTDPA